MLEDPSAQAVARVYSNALLNVAQAVDVDDVLEELGSFLDDVLEQHPDFRDILLSTIVSRDDKLAIIDRVVAPFGSELLTNFLRTLARHDRLELLPLILSESQRLHEGRTGRKRVQVTSARPLSDTALQDVRARLDAAFPFDPILETQSNPALLGGLVIRVENTVYDGSLKTRLKQLQDRLRERSLHEIQSGRDRFSHPEGD